MYDAIALAESLALVPLVDPEGEGEVET